MKLSITQKPKISLIVSAMLSVLCPFANGQQQPKPPARVGWLWYGSSPTGALPSVETAIMDGLRELGYVEGKNIVFEYRFANGHPERLPALASALVEQKPDVMIAIGGDIAVAAKNATATIPVIIGTSDDPVRASIISSFARPGGNVTGVTFVMDQVAGRTCDQSPIGTIGEQTAGFGKFAPPRSHRDMRVQSESCELLPAL